MYKEPERRKIANFLEKHGTLLTGEDSKDPDYDDPKEIRRLLVKLSKRIPERDWNELAEAMFAAGMTRKAMNLLKRIVKGRPKDKKALNNLGVIHAWIGEVERAVKLYDSALALDDSYERAWFNKGKALFKMEKLEGASACFRKVVSLNRRNVSAWNNLGLVSKLLGNLDLAARCYNKALELDREYPYAWNNLGYVHMATGRYSRALECFENALRIEPDYGPAKKGLSLCTDRMRAEKN